MLISASSGFAQVQTLEPTIGTEFDFSKERIQKFNTPEAFSECEKVYDKMGGWANYDKLSNEDKKLLSYCDEIKSDVWNIIGDGCSWYCGLKKTNLSSTSFLDASSNYTYEPNNAFDFNYQTAWIEGVNGYGTGEFLTYEFSPEQPRITKIIIANGYIKSRTAYLNNSRPKQLKLYLNNEPYAILNLQDVYAEQSFPVSAIGNSNRTDEQALLLAPKWELKFEVTEVYKGTKFEDTAITEIYFDGIDVH